MGAIQFTSKDLEGIGTKTSKTLTKLLSAVVILFRFSILGFFLFLLAGNENANPKIGKTTLEFYSLEFRRAIQENYELSDAENRCELAISQQILQFYENRQYMPVWTHNFEVTENYRQLKKIIGRSTHYGLQPWFYEFSKLNYLEALMSNNGDDQIRFEARIELEKQCSRSALLLMLHLSKGLGNSYDQSSIQQFISESGIKLQNMLDGPSFEVDMLAMQPSTKQYRQLQKALSGYLKKVTIDERSYTADNFKDYPNLLGALLVKQGLLESSFIGDTLAEYTALKEFQRIHSLETDGKAGAKTLSLLGKSTRAKFYTIALNLDRVRKETFADSNYILVNIPEFRLHYIDRAHKEHIYNVIVGKKDSPTPLLESKIQTIVANPHWTVPKSIVMNELIPKIRNDSTYLEKHGFTIIDHLQNTVDPSQLDWNNENPSDFKYKIRQTNSVTNSLGAVKFLFPNEHSVYLHDTPSKRLFSVNERAFSHGCIRVQNPDRLAQEIITADKLTQNGKLDVLELIHSNNPSDVYLHEPLAIYIRYFTCTSDSLGNVIFHPDIYSMDEMPIRQLFANSEL